MPQATWNGQILAESEETVVLDGNHYFPPDAIHEDFFEPSQTSTVCGWKGTASYYTISVGSAKNVDAAWTYPEPKPEAENIRGYVAFWKGVEVK